MVARKVSFETESQPITMEGWLRTGACSGSRPAPKRSRLDTHEIVSNDSENIVEVPIRRELGDVSEASAKTPQRSAGSTSAVKLRKYDPKFIRYGFVEKNKDENPDALCVVCQTILTNSSMVPAKLQRHLSTKHPDLISKSPAFFERAAENLKLSQTRLTSTGNVRWNEATLRISYLIGRAGESHTIAEKLLKPCFIETARCLANGKLERELRALPLSNNTVARRIRQISAWLEDQLCAEIRQSPCWAIQVDESTDVAGLAILLVFIRYVCGTRVKEELLLCSSLQSRTTGDAIFSLVDSYLKNNGLTWMNCVDVCSDGAASMTGRNKGFVSRVKEVSKLVTSSHCILHREALAMKRIPDALRKVLDDAIKIVNLIKARPLQSRIFKMLCEDMGSLHSSLLLHTEVRWLSRGRTLGRLFELRNELVMFSLDQDHEVFEKLRDSRWLQRLAYLADIFQKLNALNSTLQGREVNIFFASGKINAMKEKLGNWAVRVSDDQMDFFPTLQDFLDETGERADKEVEADISQHLSELRATFELYFPAAKMRERISQDWVRNPFTVENHVNLTASQNDLLTDIRHDVALKEKFESLPLADFWAELGTEFAELSKIALKVLLPFVTTYLCETGFSTYAATKTKYRNRLDAADDLRLQLSERAPDFSQLSRSLQWQPSH